MTPTMQNDEPKLHEIIEQEQEEAVSEEQKEEEAASAGVGTTETDAAGTFAAQTEQ